MNGVMLHGAEIDQADTDPFTVLTHQRCRIGAAAPINGMPIPVHAHGICRCGIRWNEKVLKDQSEITIHGRIVGHARMDDKKSHHTEGLLHGHVTMVKKRAGLVQIVFVDIRPAR